MCFVNDGFTCQFYYEKLRWSRKSHKCYECDREIPHHTFYLYVAAKWDGDVSSLKLCYPCSKLREFIHEYELARGCAWEESYPHFGDLAGAIIDYESEEEAQDPPKSAWTRDGWTLPPTIELVEALKARVRAAYPELKWETT